MLGCLEVVEYSLKERFNMKYLHQVSYLRLQDEIGVCLSYCCLSGTAVCVLVVVQYTAVYPVQRVYLSVQYITTSLLLLPTWYTVS